MKYFKSLSLLALIILVAWYFLPQKIHVKIKSSNNINVGISYIEKDYLVKDKTVKVTLYEVDTNVSSVGITSPQIVEKKNGKTSYSGYTLNEYLEAGLYKIVQSGGFLSTWSPPTPLGYVKIQNLEINRLHNSWLTNGIFCTNGKNFIIEEYKSEEQFKKWPSCIQAGPLIISNGKKVLNTARNTGYVTKESHRQSFMCKSYDNTLVMGLAEDIKLIDFSDVMNKPAIDGGLGCSDAVMLNSKGVSGIISKIAGNEKSLGNTEVPLPVAIVIK